MRRLLMPALFVFLLVSSCGRPRRATADNEILFSISQTATSTDARWEFLKLGHDGQVHEEFDDDCYYEPLTERRGALRVEDGMATWKTPLLAEDGIVLRADRTQAHLDHNAWRTGDVLTFDAHGFAMPEPQPLALDAPPVDLEIIAPLDGELDVSGDRDLEILWTPPSRPTRSDLAVQLDSDSRDRVICFFPIEPGHASVPAGLIQILRARSRAREGTLKIGAHRQVNVPGPGSWFLYVVASHIARSQAFSMK